MTLEQKRAYETMSEAAGDKNGKTREIVEWVMSREMDDPCKIDPSTAPSKGAVGLLKWVQHSPGALSQFIRDMYAKILIQGLESDLEVMFEADHEITQQRIERFIGYLQSDEGKHELEADFDEAFAEKESEDPEGAGRERREAIQGLPVAPE